MKYCLFIIYFWKNLLSLLLDQLKVDTAKKLFLEWKKIKLSYKKYYILTWHGLAVTSANTLKSLLLTLYETQRRVYHTYGVGCQDVEATDVKISFS